MAQLAVQLQFSGGAELLFGNKRSQDITLPNDKEWKINDLLIWIKVCDSFTLTLRQG